MSTRPASWVPSRRPWLKHEPGPHHSRAAVRRLKRWSGPSNHQFEPRRTAPIDRFIRCALETRTVCGAGPVAQGHDETPAGSEQGGEPGHGACTVGRGEMLPNAAEDHEVEKLPPQAQGRKVRQAIFE